MQEMLLVLLLKMKALTITESKSLLLTLMLFTTVGGYTTDLYNDGSNLNGDTSLCRVVRETRKSVLKSFNSQYAASGTFCDITEHCANVTCTTEFSRGRVNAGLYLYLCKDDPELMYWVDVPGQWDQQWNHTFSSKIVRPERIEISGGSNETKPTKWFISVQFSITHGHDRISQSIKYISISSILQICPSSSASEESCTNTTLLNFPRLPQSQICTSQDFSDPTEDGRNYNIELIRSESSNEWNSQHLTNQQYTTFNRPSRNANANANAWNPEQVHKNLAEKAKKLEPGKFAIPSPGDPCNPKYIFSCGAGASCNTERDESGKCQCLFGFRFDAESSVCLKEYPSPADDSLNSRSYSSAIGAIISILVLIAIAAGIYFGTKYNYFTRLRHRLPVFRCWPFRRSQPWEDNVTMVNPLGPPDDDDPLLL